MGRPKSVRLLQAGKTHRTPGLYLGDTSRRAIKTQSYHAFFDMSWSKRASMIGPNQVPQRSRPPDPSLPEPFPAVSEQTYFCITTGQRGERDWRERGIPL